MRIRSQNSQRPAMPLIRAAPLLANHSTYLVSSDKKLPDIQTRARSSPIQR